MMSLARATGHTVIGYSPPQGWCRSSYFHLISSTYPSILKRSLIGVFCFGWWPWLCFIRHYLKSLPQSVCAFCCFFCASKTGFLFLCLCLRRVQSVCQAPHLNKILFPVKSSWFYLLFRVNKSSRFSITIVVLGCVGGLTVSELSYISVPKTELLNSCSLLPFYILARCMSSVPLALMNYLK